MPLNKTKMNKLFFILLTAITILSCDNKKTSIAGTVVNATTGEGVGNVLVSYVQCKENGDNCTEVIIGERLCGICIDNSSSNCNSRATTL